MNEQQLLQLRTHILGAAGTHAKPVPHHVIADALTNTDSRDHIRYVLRVIDALVDTGELVRHINVEGGRNTYTLGTDNARRSLAVLKQRFEFDLEAAGGASTAPAEAAALPAAESTPHTLPPLPRPASDKPRTMPLVTYINPGAKPELYRPDENLRARVLGLIDESRQCSRAYVVSRLHDCRPNAVDNALWMLGKAGLVAKIAPGEYARLTSEPATAAGTSVAPKAVPPAAKRAAKVRTAEDSSAADAAPAAPMQPVFAGPIRTLDDTITDHPARDLAPPMAAAMTQVLDALQQLGATARAAVPLPKPITDLDTKLTVLRKLSPMVAADISAVLDAVANDLQAIGVAA